MYFLDRVEAAWRDEAGAVTVDWVALTAAIVVMGVVMISVVTVGINYNATRINNVVNAGASTFLSNY